MQLCREVAPRKGWTGGHACPQAQAGNMDSLSSWKSQLLDCGAA